MCEFIELPESKSGEELGGDISKLGDNDRVCNARLCSQISDLMNTLRSVPKSQQGFANVIPFTY